MTNELRTTTSSVSIAAPCRSATARAWSAIAFAAALVVTTAAPAQAQSDFDARCRADIAKRAASYARNVVKTIVKCHGKRTRGRLPASTDCNLIAEADPTDRLGKQRAKVEAAIGGPTGHCALAAPVLANYARCPSPAAQADDGGATDGIDTFTELAQCLTGLTDELVGAATREAMGLPAAALGNTEARCQKEIGKRLGKLLASYSKERRRCQSALDAAAGGMEYGCDGYDDAGKIARVASKVAAGIAKRCTPPAGEPDSGREYLDRMGSCGDSVEQLQDCVIDVAGGRTGSGLVAMAYELPADCRAGGLLRISHAGYGTQLTSSSFSAGWNGIAHGIDLTDGFIDAMQLDCDADCANCVISLDAAKSEPHSFCRCDNDASVPCDTLGGPDVDDCGLFNNVCQCHFGPPASVAAAGAPACVDIRFLEPPTGTVDLGTGEWISNEVEVAAVIYLGTDLFQPCPVCVGDAEANDGQREGSCNGGTRDGLPCDVNADQPTFGPSSHDCPPTTVTNISGSGLALAFDLITGDSTLDYELPCDNPVGRMCPCRVCSEDGSLGCSDDQRCIDADVGLCTGTGGAGVQPNECADRICNNETGECDAGPIDKFCDGKVYANGDGFVTCVTDADCSALGAGSCTLEKRRACYREPIAVGGSRGLYGANLGATACIGLTSSEVINQASGLPGAVRIALEVELEPRCGDAPGVVYEHPTGANCPTGVTSTTTTTLPTLPCESTFPVCGGDCPPGLTCQTSGVACTCAP